jgi:glycosyltransferase involved in cell wall biosynthesis
VRVALDAQLSIGTPTGIGEYVIGLAGALRAAGVDVVTLAKPGFDPWRFDRRVLWDQILLPLSARRARVDLLHCASGTMPLVRPAPTVVTVHDVAWLRVQAHAPPYARFYFGRLALAQYGRARRVLVDSAFSGRELTALAPIDPARVSVVYPGVADDVARVERAPCAAPFILVAGTVERRKNLAVVIRALAGLPGVRLVSAGPITSYRDACEAVARECGVADRVEFRGYVPRGELLRLYATAWVAAVPTTYEGFGYGAAWALCAGLPLVASNSSSLPEIVGGDAQLVQAEDVAGWRSAIAALLADPQAAATRAASVRANAVARFSWIAAAESAAAAYRRALVDR